MISVTFFVLVSIVAPVYNEEQSLHIFVQRLLSVVSSQKPDHKFEIILVDDGSTDASSTIIKEQCASSDLFKGISFTRNFGHQIALFAGIRHASGDVVITLDSDLQDPPELIPEMLKKLESGFDVVNAVRSQRDGETLTKRVFAFVFYRLLKKIVRFDIPLDSGDYRLFSNRVRDLLIRSSEGSQYIRGQIASFGFKSTDLQYVRSSRMFGSTNYPFRKSLQLAIDAVVSLSGAPLRLVSIAGTLLSLLSPLMIVTAIALLKILRIDASQSLVVIVALCSSVLAFVLGALAVLSAYVGRLMFQARRLPLYVIDRTYNFESPVSE